MDYFAHLYSTYGTDVKSVLAADPTLAAELAYDVKCHERKQKAKENKTPTGSPRAHAKTPTARTTPLSAHSARLKAKTPLSARRTPAQALAESGAEIPPVPMST